MKIFKGAKKKNTKTKKQANKIAVKNAGQCFYLFNVQSDLFEILVV